MAELFLERKSAELRDTGEEKLVTQNNRSFSTWVGVSYIDSGGLGTLVRSIYRLNKCSRGAPPPLKAVQPDATRQGDLPCR